MRFRRFLIIAILFLPMASWGETNIVPSTIKHNKEYRLAADFLEHYAQLIARPTDEATGDSIRRIKEDGFSYIVGNDGQMARLTGNEDFSIGLSNYLYTAKWSKGGKTVVECSFPANIGLLKFSNKINLENQLIESLTEASRQSRKDSLPVCPKDNLTRIALSEYYISDNGYYITPRLKNQIVYEPIAHDSVNCRMLIDADKYQLESLANMMLSGYSANPQNVQLQVNQYGYKNHSVEIPLANLFNLLSGEGCTPYWGVDTFDGNDVKGVYVWVNPYGGYAHLLSVNIPIDAVSTSANLKAKLHCYLRLDNLKSLFEEYDSL